MKEINDKAGITKIADEDLEEVSGGRRDGTPVVTYCLYCKISHEVKFLGDTQIRDKVAQQIYEGQRYKCGDKAFSIVKVNEKWTYFNDEQNPIGATMFDLF